jgi:hypothetical protein
MIASLGVLLCSRIWYVPFQYYLHRSLTELALACGSASIRLSSLKHLRKRLGLRMLLFFQLLLISNCNDFAHLLYKF